MTGTFWQSFETRRRGCRLVALVLMSAFAMVIAPTSAAAELPAGCSELNLALTEHTCFHARFGPFEERTATDGAVPTAETPDIDTVHTHYRVALAPGRTQVVTYAPARTASWAVFVDPAVPYRVQRPDGATLPPVLEHEVTDCPFLPRVRVYEFEAGVRYRYVFGPSPSSSLVVLNEKVDDFDVAHGRDADGDGHGDPALADFRACVPLPGFVESDDDCNDADPAVHPGAVEISLFMRTGASSVAYF